MTALRVSTIIPTTPVKEAVITHLFRSTLFVPGNRPERFEKAAASGADLIAIDLEDAVPQENKDEARQIVIEHLRTPYSGAAPRFIRINSPKTEAGLRDLIALIDCPTAPDGILIPMIGSASEVRWVDGLLGGTPTSS